MKAVIIMLLGLLVIPYAILGQKKKAYTIHKTSLDLLSKAHWEFIKEYKFSSEGEIKEGDSAWNSMTEFVEYFREAKDLEKGDMILAGAYGRMLQSGKLSEYERLSQITPIQKEPWRSIIDTLFNGLKKVDTSKLNSDGIYMSDQRGNKADSILLEMLKNHRGKLVYLNFWAPWCMPCHKQFKYEKKLSKEFSDQKIEFVFVASRSSVESWKLTVAKEKLKGFHYLIDDYQYEFLSTQMEVSGIPYYILFDKNGNILKKPAPRPSEEEKIRLLFNQVLTQ